MTKIALIQMRCGAEPQENLARAIEFIRDASRQGAQIVCLPELFRSQYFCQIEDHKNFDLAEEVPGESTAELGAVARETGTLIIASLFERRSAGLYHNTAAVIDTDGKLLGKYRKMHIPDDPLYHEKFYFAPGDLGFRAWDTALGRIGVCVCWDQWYPEAAQSLSFIQRQSAGIRARKRNLEKRNIPRGRRFSVVMRSQTGATSRWRTASVTKRPPVEMALNFGGKVLCAGRTAKSSRKVRSIKKRLWRRRSIGLASTSSGRIGHSCEIAESTPTAALKSG
jgi:Carbon-nitrogen hydrolase